jgi:hypothetical protein
LRPFIITFSKHTDKYILDIKYEARNTTKPIGMEYDIADVEESGGEEWLRSSVIEDITRYLNEYYKND